MLRTPIKVGTMSLDKRKEVLEEGLTARRGCFYIETTTEK